MAPGSEQNALSKPRKVRPPGGLRRRGASCPGTESNCRHGDFQSEIEPPADGRYHSTFPNIPTTYPYTLSTGGHTNPRESPSVWTRFGQGILRPTRGFFIQCPMLPHHVPRCNTGGYARGYALVTSYPVKLGNVVATYGNSIVSNWTGFWPNALEFSYGGNISQPTLSPLGISSRLSDGLSERLAAHLGSNGGFKLGGEGPRREGIENGRSFGGNGVGPGVPKTQSLFFQFSFKNC